MNVVQSSAIHQRFAQHMLKHPNVCIDDIDEAIDVQWCAKTESDTHCEPATLHTLTFETIAP